MKKERYAVRVCSRHIFADMKSQIQNLFGLRLTSYESMIHSAIESCKAELGPQDAARYRIEITEFSNEAMAVIVYEETL